MKVYTITNSRSNFTIQKGYLLRKRQLANMELYGVELGEEGRGRKLTFVPYLGELPDKGILERADIQLNPLSLVPEKYESDLALIVWNTVPGFRGTVKYGLSYRRDEEGKRVFEGSPEKLAVGWSALGDAGNVGGAENALLILKPEERIYAKIYDQTYINDVCVFFISSGELYMLTEEEFELYTQLRGLKG